jgi:hypothetical protein
MNDEKASRGRVIRLSISVVLAALVFGIAIWQGLPTGGKADTSRLLVSLLLTALGVLQLAAALWGFALWRREQAVRAAHPGALVQTCLVTAGTRDALRADGSAGPTIRISCCLVIDRDGVALVTKAAPNAPARMVPWSRVGGVGWGTQEGETRIPNAVTLEPRSHDDARFAFIPIGSGFFALNPLAPARAGEFVTAMRALEV